MDNGYVDDDINLRLLDDEDAESLFALTDANRAHLRAWLPWLDVTLTVADSRHFVATVRAQYTANEAMVMGIWYRGTLAGVVGFNWFDWANRKGEIGYWLGATFQGKGIMTRCCRRLIDFAFDECLLNRAAIPCAVGNARSCAIPQRLGFTHEGILRDTEWLYDHYVSHHIFAMLARDWPKAH